MDSVRRLGIIVGFTALQSLFHSIWWWLFKKILNGGCWGTLNENEGIKNDSGMIDNKWCNKLTYIAQV